jgi:hypothetical protein
MDNREAAKQSIKKMKRFNIDKLNNISRKFGISIYVAVFLFHATH